MTVEQVRRLYNAQPFEPFLIHLADGRDVLLLHQEFMAFLGAGRTIIVTQPDESFQIIDLLLVTALEVRPELVNGKKNGMKKKKS
ncbi:MAG: hypothetical protein L0Y72_15985 [Gemmataceae bacterium]|nr:hypothetical protein [Gemmataceae bacterium]